MRTKTKKRRWFRVIAAAVLVLALAVCVTACGETENNVPGPGTGLENWSDDWGADDWGNGYVPPSNSPSDYNKTDWTTKYGNWEGGINATLNGQFLSFFPGNGVHRYEAENAALSGKANTNEGGYYVGDLDNSSVRFDIVSETECDALMVLAAAVNPDAPDGVRFGQQYTLYCNGTVVETDDCWLYGTGNWRTFKENAVGELHLVAGSNTIELFSSLSRSNIDYIKLVPTLADAGNYPGDPTKYLPAFDLNERIEAEATHLENARNEGSNIGWTSVDTKMQFVVTNSLDVDVTRTLYINAAVGLGDDGIGELSEDIKERMTLTVNGAAAELTGSLVTVYDPSRWYRTYHDNAVAEVTLEANSTTVFSITLSDQFNVDYLELRGDPVLTGLTVGDMKTAYAVGDSVSADDLRVTAVYDHGENKILTAGSYTVSPETFTAVSDSCEVTVTYTENGITRTTAYSVRVTETPPDGPSRISVSSPVYESVYVEGAVFSVSSITVQGDYGSEWRVLENDDYKLQYSLTGDGEWTDDLTLPELDERQELQRETTVFVRASLTEDASLTAVTSVGVTVYDRKLFDLTDGYLPYDTDIAGTTNDGFVSFWPGNGAHRYEAEKGAFGGIADARNHWYVGNLRRNGDVDATVTFTIDSAAEEECAVLLVAALSVNPSFVPSGGNDAYFAFDELTGNKVTVNGVDVAMSGMVKHTKGWENFAENAIGTITLRPGENTVVFTFAADATNFDCIKIVPSLTDAAKYPADMSKLGAVYSPDDRIEAEAVRFVDAEVEIGSSDTHLSNTKKSSRVEFIIENTSGASVEKTLVLHAAVKVDDDWSANAADRMTLTVNGSAVTLDGTLTSTGTSSSSWWQSSADHALATVTLDAGYNTIVLTLDEQLNPDYFAFV